MINHDIDTSRNDGRVTPEESLWAAVLHQSLEDAVDPRQFILFKSRRKKDKDPNGLIKLWAREAQTWIFTPNPDFKTVCELAGLDPAAVQLGLKKVLSKEVKI